MSPGRWKYCRQYKPYGRDSLRILLYKSVAYWRQLADVLLRVRAALILDGEARNDRRMAAIHPHADAIRMRLRHVGGLDATGPVRGLQTGAGVPSFGRHCNCSALRQRLRRPPHLTALRRGDSHRYDSSCFRAVPARCSKTRVRLLPGIANRRMRLSPTPPAFSSMVSRWRIPIEGSASRREASKRSLLAVLKRPSSQNGP